MPIRVSSFGLAQLTEPSTCAIVRLASNAFPMRVQPRNGHLAPRGSVMPFKAVLFWEHRQGRMAISSRMSTFQRHRWSIISLLGMITTPPPAHGTVPNSCQDALALRIPRRRVTEFEVPTSDARRARANPTRPRAAAQRHPRCADTLRDSAICGTRSVYGIFCRSAREGLLSMNPSGFQGGVLPRTPIRTS